MKSFTLLNLKALDSLTGKVDLNDDEKKTAQVAFKGLVESRGGNGSGSIRIVTKID